MWYTPETNQNTLVWLKPQNRRQGERYYVQGSEEWSTEAAGEQEPPRRQRQEEVQEQQRGTGNVSCGNRRSQGEEGSAKEQEVRCAPGQQSTQKSLRYSRIA